MKYNENIILAKLKDYIRRTYKQHYSTNTENEQGLQAIDVFRELNIDKDYCQANAIKYLMRYGKKQGRNENDLYKAIHYIILLISSEDKDKYKDTTSGRLYGRGENWSENPPAIAIIDKEKTKKQ